MSAVNATTLPHQASQLSSSQPSGTGAHSPSTAPAAGGAPAPTLPSPSLSSSRLLHSNAMLISQRRTMATGTSATSAALLNSPASRTSTTATATSGTSSSRPQLTGTGEPYAHKKRPTSSSILHCAPSSSSYRASSKQTLLAKQTNVAGVKIGTPIKSIGRSRSNPRYGHHAGGNTTPQQRVIDAGDGSTVESYVAATSSLSSINKKDDLSVAPSDKHKDEAATIPYRSPRSDSPLDTLTTAPVRRRPSILHIRGGGGCGLHNFVPKVGKHVAKVDPSSQSLRSFPQSLVCHRLGSSRATAAATSSSAVTAIGTTPHPSSNSMAAEYGSSSSAPRKVSSGGAERMVAPSDPHRKAATITSSAAAAAHQRDRNTMNLRKRSRSRSSSKSRRLLPPYSHHGNDRHADLYRRGEERERDRGDRDQLRQQQQQDRYGQKRAGDSGRGSSRRDRSRRRDIDSSRKYGKEEGTERWGDRVNDRRDKENLPERREANRDIRDSSRRVGRRVEVIRDSRQQRRPASARDTEDAVPIYGKGRDHSRRTAGDTLAKYEKVRRGDRVKDRGDGGERNRDRSGGRREGSEGRRTRRHASGGDGERRGNDGQSKVSKEGRRTERFDGGANDDRGRDDDVDDDNAFENSSSRGGHTNARNGEGHQNRQRAVSRARSPAYRDGDGAVGLGGGVAGGGGVLPVHRVWSPPRAPSPLAMPPRPLTVGGIPRRLAEIPTLVTPHTGLKKGEEVAKVQVIINKAVEGKANDPSSGPSDAVLQEQQKDDVEGGGGSANKPSTHNDDGVRGDSLCRHRAVGEPTTETSELKEKRREEKTEAITEEGKALHRLVANGGSSSCSFSSSSSSRASFSSNPRSTSSFSRSGSDDYLATTGIGASIWEDDSDVKAVVVDKAVVLRKGGGGGGEHVTIAPSQTNAVHTVVTSGEDTDNTAPVNVTVKATGDAEEESVHIITTENLGKTATTATTALSVKVTGQNQDDAATVNTSAVLLAVVADNANDADEASPPPAACQDYSPTAQSVERSFSPDPRSPSSRHRVGNNKSPHYNTYGYSDDSDYETRYPRFDGGLPRRKGAVPFLSLLQSRQSTRHRGHRHNRRTRATATCATALSSPSNNLLNMADVNNNDMPALAFSDGIVNESGFGPVHVSEFSTPQHQHHRSQLVPLLPPSSRRKPMVIATAPPAEGELPSLPILPPSTSLVAYGTYIVHQVLGRGVGSIVVKVSRLPEQNLQYGDTCDTAGEDARRGGCDDGGEGDAPAVGMDSGVFTEIPMTSFPSTPTGAMPVTCTALAGADGVVGNAAVGGAPLVGTSRPSPFINGVERGRPKTVGADVQNEESSKIVGGHDDINNTASTANSTALTTPTTTGPSAAVGSTVVVGAATVAATRTSGLLASEIAVTRSNVSASNRRSRQEGVVVTGRGGVRGGTTSGSSQRITTFPKPPQFFGLKIFRGWSTYDRAADEEAEVVNSVLSKTHCPYLMPVIEKIEHPSHCALLFPLCGMSLLDVLEGNRTKGLSKGLPHPIVKSILFQILTCIKNLHAAGVIHTDLKPENVLFRSTDTTIMSFVVPSHFTPPTPLGTGGAVGNVAATSTISGGSGGAAIVGVGGAAASSSRSTLRGRDRTGGGGGSTNNHHSNAGTGVAVVGSSTNAVTGGIQQLSSTSSSVQPIVKTVRVPVTSSVYVIDLGNAVYADDLVLEDEWLESRPRVSRSYIQTRHYRAPEVLFDAGWDHSSDLWSVGCMISELLTGDCLFPMHNDAEHIALMEKAAGPIPSYLYAKTKIAREFCAQYSTTSGSGGGSGNSGAVSSGNPLGSPSAGLMGGATSSSAGWHVTHSSGVYGGGGGVGVGLLSPHHGVGSAVGMGMGAGLMGSTAHNEMRYSNSNTNTTGNTNINGNGYGGGFMGGGCDIYESRDEVNGNSSISAAAVVAVSNTMNANQTPASTGGGGGGGLGGPQSNNNAITYGISGVVDQREGVASNGVAPPPPYGSYPTGMLTPCVGHGRQAPYYNDAAAASAMSSYPHELNQHNQAVYMTMMMNSSATYYDHNANVAVEPGYESLIGPQHLMMMEPSAAAAAVAGMGAASQLLSGGGLGMGGLGLGLLQMNPCPTPSVNPTPHLFLKLRSSYMKQLSRSALRSIERQRTVRRIIEKNVGGEEGKRLADLVEGLLRYDPAKRLTAAEALRHPYFTQLW